MAAAFDITRMAFNGSTLNAILDGKYRLVREIGVGGSSSVYEAEHLVVGKRVAIKLLRPEIAQDPIVRERFLAEARAAARIRHANVVDVYDTAVSSDGIPYLVMELLEGETLTQIIARRGRIAPGYACELMTQVLAALGAAHASGIIHRDLKPDNVIVTHPRPNRPLVKVLDFGLAQCAHGGDAADGGHIVGTFRYIAPEQALGERLDARADVYAAAVVLYEMLSGVCPFSGNAKQVLTSVVTGRWTPIEEIEPEVPAAVAGLIAEAMALDPNVRPRSAATFAKRLSDLVMPGKLLSLFPVSSSNPFPLVRNPHTLVPALASPSIAGYVAPKLARVAYTALTESLLIAPKIPPPPGLPQLSRPEFPLEWRIEIPAFTRLDSEAAVTTHRPESVLTSGIHRRRSSLIARYAAGLVATMGGFAGGLLIAWLAGLL